MKGTNSVMMMSIAAEGGLARNKQKSCVQRTKDEFMNNTNSNHPPSCNVPPLMRSTKSIALEFSDSSSRVPEEVNVDFVFSLIHRRWTRGRVKAAAGSRMDQYGSAILINVPMTLSLISTWFLDVLLDYLQK
ncbi:hypothetical protein Bca52824_045067 [Brassica carinata]|uniref:Uncharacterized protein n=1 Tax=Brassica carinata TaxID=52824 RepID=A0A8X7RCQ8_BRACI|nr:hypothetical protein Bca52824_045067 [Brassica carinata]